MKKVLAIVAIAAFAACNNGNNEASTVDSAKYKDSVAKAEAAKVVDTTKKVVVDSTIKVVDSTKMEKK